MSPVAPAFLIALALLALGYALRRSRALPENTAQTLNTVVLYVCLPAAVLRYVPRLTWSPDLLAIAAVPWLLLPAIVFAVALCARVLRLRDDRRAVLLLTVALGNTSFLGYPLTRALIGEHALPYAVVYDQLGAFLMLSTFGLWVLARYGGDATPTARAMLVRILRFPPLWALILGATAMPAQPPAWIDEALRMLADALLPLAMLTVGLSVRFAMPRDELAPLGAGLTLKLVAVPAAAFALAPWLGLHGEIARTTVFEAAMPPMITAGALAIAHNLAPRLAAAMVGYGLLLSLLTLPWWAGV
ncbi:MAG: AEC family transporter [Lysobacter sp.]|nr:MAG: AEC family transporter [Lysobacter sp.]